MGNQSGHDLALDAARDLIRANTYLVLTERLRGLMVHAVPRDCTESTVDALGDVVTGLQALARAPEGRLLDPLIVAGSLAEATEWLARAHHAMGHDHRALELFAVARARFASLQRTVDAERVEESMLEVQLEVDGDLTRELGRLHRLLERAPEGSRRRATLLVQLGEIREHVGDDRGAVEALEEAEAILSTPEHRLPDARMLLRALDESLEALAQPGARLEGPSSIECASALRNLYRRLYAAMARAASTADRAKANRYARLAARIEGPPDVGFARVRHDTP